MYSGTIPPSYVDIGKQARDIFIKGYHFGLWILDCKSKTSSGIEIRTTGKNNLESGKIMGLLETKYKYKDYGLILTGKWNTENTLFGEASVHDQIVDGLMLGVEVNYSVETDAGDTKLKAAYGRENFKLDADTFIELEAGLSVINASAVVGYENLVGGYQTTFNVQDSSLVNNNFALGFTQDPFSIHVACNDGGEVFLGSLLHRTTDKLSCAVQFSCTKDFNDEGGEFSVGARYIMDPEATLAAKISTEGQVGLSYQQKLHKGITLTLSSLINGKDFNAGGHQIGVALELEV